MILTDEPMRDEAVIRFLRAVHRHGLRLRSGVDDVGFAGLTHVEAARLAGLSRPSVHSFAKRMRGTLLREDALAIRPGAGYAIGVDIGRAHHARVALSDVHGAVLDVLPNESGGLLTYQTAQDALDSAEQGIRNLLDEHGIETEQLVGVGISLPGPVRGHHAIGSEPSPWRRISAADELARRLDWEDVKFSTGNDTYLSALAESLWGGGPVSDHTVYVKWSVGLRAALVVEGQLYTGHSGTAGELGHIIVDQESHDVCDVCKEAGCVHAIASLRTIARIAGDERLRAADVVERALDDETTMRALKTAARGIGKAVAPYVAALNPEVLIIGGALGSRAFPLVLDELTGDITEGNAGNGDDVSVVGARLQRRTATQGAVALALLEFGPAHLRTQAQRAQSVGATVAR